MILARHTQAEGDGLSVSMQSDLGSTRASACPDRRLAARNGSAIPLRNGDSFVHDRVVGEGANQSTRGLERSRSEPNINGSSARSANVRFGGPLRPLGLLLRLLLFGSGCWSFGREWKAAAATPAANGSTGRWQGTWLSHSNEHTGKLRCLISPQSNDVYQARFHATYGKALSYSYTAPLQAQNADGVFQFRGDANLGWLAGGRYHYEGQASQTNFFCIYRCKRDHGVFEMIRPE